MIKINWYLQTFSTGTSSAIIFITRKFTTSQNCTVCYESGRLRINAHHAHRHFCIQPPLGCCYESQRWPHADLMHNTMAAKSPWWVIKNLKLPVQSNVKLKSVSYQFSAFLFVKESKTMEQWWTLQLWHASTRNIDVFNPSAHCSN